MAKKKQSKFLRNLLIICLPLILVQAGVLFKYKQSSTQDSFKDAMDKAVETSDKINPDQQAIIKIQLALSDYRIKSDKYPDSLEDLIPDYFDEVPIDPQTAEPFKYTREGEAYLLGQAAGASKESKSDESLNEEDLLLTSLDAINQETYVYDPTNKKDPFRSYNFEVNSKRNKGKNPLEQFDYAELRLTAVLLNLKEPKAIVEDGNGRGHTVNIGTVIGLYGGKIVRIEKDKIVVLEDTIEFTGEKTNKTIDIFLPQETNDYGSLTKEQSLGKSKIITN